MYGATELPAGEVSTILSELGHRSGATCLQSHQSMLSTQPYDDGVGDLNSASRACPLIRWHMTPAKHAKCATMCRVCETELLTSEAFTSQLAELGR